MGQAKIYNQSYVMLLYTLDSESLGFKPGEILLLDVSDCSMTQNSNLC